MNGTPNYYAMALTGAVTTACEVNMEKMPNNEEEIVTEDWEGVPQVGDNPIPLFDIDYPGEL